MKFLVFSLAVLVTAGCNANRSEAVDPQAGASGTAQLPPGHPTTGTSAELPPGHPGTMGTSSIEGPDHVSGVVREAIASAGFIYLRLETQSGEEWAAVQGDATPPLGSGVTIHVATTVRGFHARSIDRTFETLHFGSFEGEGEAAHTSAPLNRGAGPTPLATNLVDFVRSSGASTRSIADIYAARGSLGGQNVTVRGEVVKYTAGVMGKNWIHLRDGSGSSAAGTDDITITTLDTADVGSLVTATGVLRLDRDFGSGYAYPVIIEDARLVK